MGRFHTPPIRVDSARTQVWFTDNTAVVPAKRNHNFAGLISVNLTIDPTLKQNQQHAEPRPGERVVLWCLYDPDANEAKPWRVQWKEGGERMGTRKGRDDVRVKASRVCLPPDASLICLPPGASLTVKGPPPDAS